MSGSRTRACEPLNKMLDKKANEDVEESYFNMEDSK